MSLTPILRVIPWKMNLTPFLCGPYIPSKGLITSVPFALIRNDGGPRPTLRKQSGMTDAVDVVGVGRAQARLTRVALARILVRLDLKTDVRGQGGH